MSAPICFSIAGAKTLQSPTVREYVSKCSTASRAQVAKAHTAAALASLLAFTAVNSFPAPANAVISQGLCVSGEGPGCEAASEDNPLIRELQQRSLKNKDKNDQATRDKYWKEGYGSYFKFSLGKELVKNAKTGKWSLEVPDDTISKAIRESGVLPKWEPY